MIQQHPIGSEACGCLFQEVTVNAHYNYRRGFLERRIAAHIQLKLYILCPCPAVFFVCCRCTALAEMQRLADEALSREHAVLFPSTKASAEYMDDSQASTIPWASEGKGGENSPKHPSRKQSQDHSQERSRSSDGEEAGGYAVAKLLACWRSEVLKQLLQRGAAAEVGAEESRKAARQVGEEREARARAETNVKVPWVCVEL